LTGSIIKASEAIASGAASVLPKALSTGMIDGGLQMLGLADNPFMTVAFKGPNFKTHSFAWRLAPKTVEESDTILNIINTFKKSAYPEILSAAVGGFYTYPKIIWPKFMPDAARNHLYNFKPCVITNINANKSPNDRPGFYAGSSAPLEIVLELGLMEIELWRNGSDGFLGVTGIGNGNGDFNNVQSLQFQHPLQVESSKLSRT
jgi:hypothetical protein